MCSEVFNIHVDWSVSNQTISKERAHKELYTKLRQQFPELPSGLLQTTRDSAMEAMKAWRLKNRDVEKENAYRTKLNLQRVLLTTKTGRKRKRALASLPMKRIPKLPRKSATSSIRYDRRVITLRGMQVSLSTLGKRQKSIVNIAECYHYFSKSSDWKFAAAQVCYNCQDGFSLRLIYTSSEPEKLKSGRVIGIDLGLYNLATMSDGTRYRNAMRRASQRRYCYTRRTLQIKGTRSAKRRLKLLSGKEKRFNLDVDHCITKDIVSRDASVFVVEDLTHIRRYKKGRMLNKWLGSWTFSAFRMMLEYKSRSVGKRVVSVDARYTSQKCSRCGSVDKASRDRSWYCCTRCGMRMDADLNASHNIMQNYLDAVSDS